LDKNDIVLCQLLLINSRMSYRELADKLGLSVTAVHNRIQALVEAGVIRRFKAGLSVLVQNSVHVLIYGISKAATVSSIKSKMEKHGSIYWLAVAGGNTLYIGAYLRDIAELEGLVRSVKENAEIPEPTVGLTTSPIPPSMRLMKIDTKMCDLDYKIVHALKDDSRKATSDIAEEVGASAKTVSRRLTRMQKNFLIELGIDWYPDASNDIMSMFHVRLKDDANPNTANIILQKHCPNTIFYWSFSNIPNNYVFMIWTTTSKELKDIRESFEANPAVQSVTPNVVYTGYIFPTWRNNF
jgi:DNA-binding Lrp family transcriptional regulator